MTHSARPLWTANSIALFDDDRIGAAIPGGLLFRAPYGVIEAHAPEDIALALDALARARRDGLHAAGFFSYELGLALEPRLAPRLPRDRHVPLLSFGLFAPPARLSPQEVDAFLSECGGTFHVTALEPAWSEDVYRQRFNAVRDLLSAGDVYQINLTFPFHFAFDGHPAALFRALRRTARAGYGAYLDLKDLSVLSLSPELFVEGDGTVLKTRPMKGTAARAPTLERDEQIRTHLARDPKSQAENLMIVDLLRNDLGRVGKTGSVAVTRLFEVETYPTLHQMTSTVQADLRPSTDFREILRALFPSGSVTGAPKIRAMEIIRTLEDTPRGLYCGAIGHIAPNGSLKLNVSIRTLTIDENGKGTLGIGSGLVYDSKPEAEYAECLLKAAFLTHRPAPFSLIETLRWTAAEGYDLLARHLERLCRSARYFGFPFDADNVKAQLDRAAKDFGEDGRRVRLTLDRDGQIQVTDGPLPPPPTAPLKLVVSARRVQSDDPFLYHKTTHRGVYDAEAAHLAETLGADEVLFMNERDELTEGSRTNLFVQRGDRLLTPPVSSGLLAGTLRAQLLVQGHAQEGLLGLEDLAQAERLFVGNGVRGLLPALYAGLAPSPS